VTWWMVDWWIGEPRPIFVFSVDWEPRLVNKVPTNSPPAEEDYKLRVSLADVAQEIGYHHRSKSSHAQ